MKKILIILCVAFFASCDCEQLKQAELFIKKVEQLFDYFGNPITNLFTGQPVTQELPNVMFYNMRSGEYFNPEFGPTFPTLVGDVIQFASLITNGFEELGECQALVNSKPTKMNLPIDFTFPNGQTQLYNIEGNVPTICPNERMYGVGGFQILGPGHLDVDEVTVDPTNNVAEYVETNNVTQIGVGANVNGRRISGIDVSGVRMQEHLSATLVQVDLTGNPEDLEIFRNMTSASFSTLASKYEKRGVKK